MIVSDKTIEVTSFSRANISGKNFANNPMRASSIGTVAATKNLKQALAANPDFFNFDTTGEGMKVVQKSRCLYIRYKRLQLRVKCN